MNTHVNGSLIKILGVACVTNMAVSKEIFLSYGREEETLPFVSKLQQDLEKNGFSVWLDSKDIPAGR